jgi:ABC-type lipoprotein release transport system permease subunit
MPRFSWNSLKHFWQIHLTVALCTAVATGVLAGALIVGDSVRGSLRSLTTERLGTIQHALLTDHFFQPDLLQRENKVPAILLNGTIVAPQTQTRASKVNIAGVTDDFFTFWQEDTAPNLSKAPEQPFNAIVINAALQNELNVQVGDMLLVNMSQAADIHPEFLLGERDTANAIQSLRLVISDIIPTENFGRFSLQANQSLPFNAFIALPVLQKALAQLGKVNALFTTEPAPISSDMLTLTLEELDLYITEHENHIDLQSQQFLLEPVLSETALLVASENNIPKLPTLTYLANTISIIDSSQQDKSTSDAPKIPYSTILALPIEKGLFSEFLSRYTTQEQQNLYGQAQQQELEQRKLKYSEETKKIHIELDKIEKDIAELEEKKRELRGTPEFTQRVAEVKSALSKAKIKTNALRSPVQLPEIYFNRWAADDLGVKVGDKINVTYYSVSADEDYITENAQFILKGIVPIEDIAGDTNLIPKFPGIHDTADISEWEPPFAIDYSLIRSKDEDYWDKYKATPKAFVTLDTGKRLWQNRFGDLTTIRMETAPEQDIKATRSLFETEFLKKIKPEQIGFQFISLQEEGLKASAGSTDFGMLFSSLSGFIIIAVALLVGMVFRIGVEQRSREIGILQAVGYTLTKIRRHFLLEGIFIASIGSLLGCLIAIGYAQLMIFGLQTWWLPAIGTPFLKLHVNLLSLLSGALISLLVVVLSIRMTVRKLGKVSTVSLLAGQTDFGKVNSELKQKDVNVSMIRLVYIIPFVLGGLAGILIEHLIVKFIIFIICILGLGWTIFEKWLRSQKVSNRLNKFQFALKNTARQPARSKTCVITISLACCIIVAVGANRHDALPETEYAFVAESSLPLHHSLNTSDGRAELGFDDKDSELLSASEVFPFRVLSGEDVSCLNLYQPGKPQILGASDAMLNEDPWQTLKLDNDIDSKIHAIGDEKSLRWILHHDPKEDFLIQDEFGKSLYLALETVSNSLFQSQLIISESDFTKHFPSQSGYQFFLIRTPPELRQETLQILEKTLEDYGFDVMSASERLASFRAVENTYISTFQSLGGLGVLLGTFGLALVLFRNIIERRGELATLRAFGYRKQLLANMLFFESCFLLTIGMLIGVAAGIVAILGSQGHLPSFPWLSLTITLLFIFGFGIIANSIAVAVALRSPLLSTLKTE